MCQASRIQRPGNQGEVNKWNKNYFSPVHEAKKGVGATESRAGILGTFHSLPVLVSCPLGRLRLLLALLLLLLLLLLLALHLLHVPEDGTFGRALETYLMSSTQPSARPGRSPSVKAASDFSPGFPKSWCGWRWWRWWPGRDCAGSAGGGHVSSCASLGGWAGEDQHFGGDWLSALVDHGALPTTDANTWKKQNKTESWRGSDWPAGSPGQWVLGDHSRLPCQGPPREWAHSHFICLGHFCSMF